MNEDFRILSGKWQDTYTAKDGTKTVSDVHHNQIQDSAYVVVASLLANQFSQANVPVATPTTFGISHIDYGSGDVLWDAQANQPVQQLTTQTQCTNAVYRQAINQSQITFVPVGDPFGGVGVSQTPTDRIRLTLVLTEQEPATSNGDISLREFGIFCRYNDDANTADLINEGLMFNWVIHPLIEKDDTLRIDRVIEISISRCP